MAVTNVNRLLISGKVVFDVTNDTVTPNDLVKGVTAHDKGGTAIVGTVEVGSPKSNIGDISTSFVESTVLGSDYKSITLTGKSSTDVLMRKGSEYSLSSVSSNFGDATVSDVAKGKTFTSKTGLKQVGTYEPPAAEPTLQDKTVTPSATEQVIAPDSGYDGLSQVTVSGDSNLIADNIKSGVSIFGITGTLAAAASDNNVEAYVIDATNPTVSFKTGGTIKVYGYGYTTSSSGWGGSSTTVHAFCGDGYYKSASWGSPSKTSCTFGVSNGMLTGLPTLNDGALIAVVGL